MVKADPKGGVHRGDASAVGRRRFVFWLGGAGALSLTGGLAALFGLGAHRAEAQGKPAAPDSSAAPAEPKISDEARALHGVLIARYGTGLDAAQSQGLLESVEGNVQSGRALRAKKLLNGQEPQAIFRAAPPVSAPSAEVPR